MFPARPLFSTDASGKVTGLVGPGGLRSLIADPIITKIKAAAAAAKKGNPVISAPLTPPWTYATGQAVLVGTVTTNGGNQYICVQQIASTTTAPTGTGATGTQGGYAPITDGTGSWMYQGRVRTAAAQSVAPTVGFGQNYSGYANSNAYNQYDSTNYYGRYYLATAARAANQAGDVQGQWLSKAGWQQLDIVDPITNAACFLFSGGVPSSSISVVNGINTIQFPCANGNPVNPSVAFETASPYIVFNGSLANSGIKVDVDGVRVSDSLLFSTGTGQLVLDLSGQALKERVIRLSHLSNNAAIKAFSGIYVSTGFKVSAPKNINRFRMGWVGDSLLAGGGINNPTNDLSVPQQVGALLGCDDVWNFGIGGTGFITNGPAVNQITHISDAINAQLDVLIVAGNYNDTGNTVAQMQAAVLTWLQTFRSACPNTIIIVCGTWQEGTNILKANGEAAMLGAFTAFNDSRSKFIPIINDPAGPWNDGSGNVTTAIAYPPTGTGSAIYFTGPDGVHQTPLGVDYMARRYADAIEGVLL